MSDSDKGSLKIEMQLTDNDLRNCVSDLAKVRQNFRARKKFKTYRAAIMLIVILVSIFAFSHQQQPLAIVVLFYGAFVFLYPAWKYKRFMLNAYRKIPGMMELRKYEFDSMTIRHESSQGNGDTAWKEYSELVLSKYFVWIIRDEVPSAFIPKVAFPSKDSLKKLIHYAADAGLVIRSVAEPIKDIV